MSRPAGTLCAAAKEPVRVSIPRYVLRGQGKDEHFEFEVKVSPLGSGTFTSVSTGSGRRGNVRSKTTHLKL